MNIRNSWKLTDAFWIGVGQLNDRANDLSIYQKFFLLKKGKKKVRLTKLIQKKEKK